MWENPDDRDPQESKCWIRKRSKLGTKGVSKQQCREVTDKGWNERQWNESEGENREIYRESELRQRIGEEKEGGLGKN